MCLKLALPSGLPSVSLKNLHQFITSRPSTPASCACMKSEQNDFYTSLIGTFKSKLSNRSEKMSITDRGKECVVNVVSVQHLENFDIARRRL